MSVDALRQALTNIVLGILRQNPDVVYWSSFMGTIIESDGNRCSVDLDNSNKFPQRLTNCRLLRPDGFKSISPNGTRVFVFWAEHKSDLRYAVMAYDGNGTATDIELAADNTITFLTPVTIADKDLVSEHEIGKSAGTISATANTPITIDVSVTGNDTAFELSFSVADMQTLLAGLKIADVTLARDFSNQLLAIGGVNQGGAWPASSDLMVSCSLPKTVSIYYNGQTSIAGPVSGLSLTVFVRGNV